MVPDSTPILHHSNTPVIFSDYHSHPQGHRVQRYTQALLQPWIDSARAKGIIDIAPGELLRAIGYAIEHLISPTEVVDGTEDEIEPLRIFLDPFSSSGTCLRIVIKLDPGANFYIRIFFA